MKSRDNDICGDGGLNHISDKDFNSLNIEQVDLSENNICDKFSVKLLKLVQTNYFIENLNLKGNKMINYSNIEQIDEECRKNYLIKKHI